MKEDALKFQRTVNREKDLRVGQVSPIEDEWRALRDKCDTEDAAEAAARQKIIDDRVAERVALLNGIGVMVQLGMYEGETLAAMADNVFQSHYARDKAVWDAAEAKRIADEKELARLQAEEAARVAAAAETKRLADEAEAARLEAQRVAQEKEQARLDGLARAQREEGERLAAQAQELKASLTRARWAEIRLYVASMTLEEVAAIADEDWEGALEKAKAAAALREEEAKKAAEAQKEFYSWVEKIGALGVAPSDYIQFGMTAEAFESQYALAVKDADARDAAATVSRLRADREKILSVTPGYSLINDKPADLGLLSEDDLAALVTRCGELERQRVADEARVAAERTAAESARLAAMKPDHEAMAAYADELRNVTRAVVHTPEAVAAMDEWQGRFDALVAELEMP